MCIAVVVAMLVGADGVGCIGVVRLLYGLVVIAVGSLQTETIGYGERVALVYLVVHAARHDVLAVIVLVVLPGVGVGNDGLCVVVHRVIYRGVVLACLLFKAAVVVQHEVPLVAGIGERFVPFPVAEHIVINVAVCGEELCLAAHSPLIALVIGLGVQVDDGSIALVLAFREGDNVDAVEAGMMQPLDVFGAFLHAIHQQHDILLSVIGQAFAHSAVNDAWHTPQHLASVVRAAPHVAGNPHYVFVALVDGGRARDYYFFKHFIRFHA